jgi:hypothetical protein
VLAGHGLALSVSLLLCACGGSSNEDVVTAAPVDPATTAMGSDSLTPEVAAFDCAQYRDRSGESEISIAIRNERDTPVYLQPWGCALPPLVGFVTVWRGDAEVNVHGFPGECGGPVYCQELQDGSSPDLPEVCSLDCFYPHPIRIEPGAVLAAGVFRTEFVRHSDRSGLGRMPEACYGGTTPANSFPGVECDSRVPLQGPLRVTAEASTALGCVPEPGSPCDCDPGADGTCVTYRGAGTGDELTATADMPSGTTTVLVTFSVN